MTLQVIVTAFAVVMLAALGMMACGPAAQPGQEATEVPATSTPPTPALAAQEPTDTPLPTKPPETSVPTLPPKPTETPRPVLPTKPPETPVLTLPPKPTETPEPVFTPALTGPPPTRAPNLPHPEGLEGCFGMNTFTTPTDEFEKYFRWCGQQLLTYVQSSCMGIGDSDSELECANELLTVVVDFSSRFGILPCLAISDRDESMECWYRNAEVLKDHDIGLYEGWSKVQAVVSRDDAVSIAYKDVLECLSQKGYDKINPELLFPWQRFDSPEEYKKREEGFTDEDKRYRTELAWPSDDCAKQSGLYEAQDAAWVAEIESLVKEEPEVATPLVESGLLQILKEPGAASFFYAKARP